MSRLGVLGGTFDPPHIGHLVVAQDVHEALELDRLLVVPAPRPPHRDAALPAEVRLELTRRAFRGDGRVEVSDVEFRREGPSYTVDTLEELRAERAPSELWCVIGADQLGELHGWHRPRRILEVARLAVMSRGGELPRPGGEARDFAFRAVPVTRIELSSTRVRERLAEGRSVRYLVPESVREPLERAWRAVEGSA